MHDVSTRDGRTVFFVSHNLDSIMRLCTRAILLSSGKMLAYGDSKSVIERYIHAAKSESKEVPLSHVVNENSLNSAVRFLKLEFTGQSLKPWQIEYGRNLSLSISFEIIKPVEIWQIGIGLFSIMRHEIATWQNPFIKDRHLCSPGVYRIEVEYDNLTLVPGQYYLGIGFRSERGIDQYVPEAVVFEVASNEASAALGADSFEGYVVPGVKFHVVHS
jgi:hypothetical protein